MSHRRPEPPTTRVNRRSILRSIPAVGMAGLLAGCTGGDTDDAAGDDADPMSVEVLHGWTGGDGAKAAESLAAAWADQYPDITLEMNPIGGGGNQNLDAVVANRLQSNDPPGSFANWPGTNLRRYEGVLGEVDDVWADAGFEDVMVSEAVDLHRQDGAFRAVPLGSHRLNCLFYNVAVVEEAGIDVDAITSMGAFFDALDAVSTETDAIPMTQAMAGTWTVTQLWAAVMLGTNGYDAYMDFIAGDGDEAAVRAAFENTARIHEDYISDDASSLDLTASNQNIINGDAAFIHQGNWAAGAYRNAEGFDYGTDWGFKTFPGTEGMYTLHFDSFLYPSNNPSPTASKTFLEFVGSPEAQIAFNQYKGSIPTRTDVDMGEFGQYLQETADDFAAASERPPTLQHGLAVESSVMTALNEVISTEFTGPYNVDAATAGFLDATAQ